MSTLLTTVDVVDLRPVRSDPTDTERAARLRRFVEHKKQQTRMVRQNDFREPVSSALRCRLKLREEKLHRLLTPAREQLRRVRVAGSLRIDGQKRTDRRALSV